MNADAEAHFFASLGDGDGHALVLSLSDLSVWCYLCGGYVKHDRLLPFLMRAEALKFGTEEKTALLAGAQTRFETGLLLLGDVAGGGGGGGGEEDTDGKLSPAQGVLEHLKARSLLAKMVRVASLADAQAAGLKSLVVLGASGEQEAKGELAADEGVGKVRAALEAAAGGMVVLQATGQNGDRGEVEACIRVLLGLP